MRRVTNQSLFVSFWPEIKSVCWTTHRIHLIWRRVTSPCFQSWSWSWKDAFLKMLRPSKRLRHEHWRLFHKMSWSTHLNHYWIAVRSVLKRRENTSNNKFEKLEISCLFCDLWNQSRNLMDALCITIKFLIKFVECLQFIIVATTTGLLVLPKLL